MQGRKGSLRLHLSEDLKEVREPCILICGGKTFQTQGKMKANPLKPEYIWHFFEEKQDQYCWKRKEGTRE